MSKTVLVVDDDPTFVKDLSSALTPLGYRVLEAFDATGAFEALEENNRIDLMIVDLNLPDKSGLELIHKTAHRDGGMKVLATTGAFGALHLEIATYMGAHITTLKFGQEGDEFPAEQWRDIITKALRPGPAQPETSN